MRQCLKKIHVLQSIERDRFNKTGVFYVRFLVIDELEFMSVLATHTSDFDEDFAIPDDELSE